MIITVIVTIIAAYLIGSINFAVIFAKAFLKKDVRTLGSGNAGATNVLRNAGPLPGALTFLCDALKGFVAVFIGKQIFLYLFNNGTEWAQPIYGAYLCGLFCMIGHIYPIFFQFKGGKGIATSVGIYSVCSPIAIISGLGVFIAVTAISKMVSLGSILSAIVVVTLSIIFHDETAHLAPQIILSVIMGVIVIAKHNQNIKRLLNGTESKIGKSKKKK